MTMATTNSGGGGGVEGTSSSSTGNVNRAPHSTSSSVGNSTAIATANANARAEAVNAVAGLPMAHNSYDELKLIGNGAYGTVYLGKDRSNEGRLVALKKIRVTLTDDGVPVNALREISLLKQLEKFEHPNIVRLLDICHGRTDHERERRLTLILVFEYVEQDLDHYLKNCPSPGLDSATIKNLMHQVLCGVDFLHKNRVIHRDLKPQNLLVSKYQRVKIADFGLARIYDFNMRLTTMVVTLWYRAPEVLLSNTYATPVDIWSCGCIFAELFRRKPLFEGQTEGDQLQRIFDVIGRPLESEWPRDISLSLSNFRDHIGRPFEDLVPEITPDAVDLLRKMLKFVPGVRICAKDALNHPYFRGLTQPRTSTATNRNAPTQQMMSPNRSPTTTTSPLSQRQISTITNTISSTTISSSSPVVVATAAAAASSSQGSNDENNPNAVNSSQLTGHNNNTLLPAEEPPKLASSSPTINRESPQTKL